MDKARKMELKRLAREQERQEFVRNLPMEVEKFERLFAFLDENLELCGCDHTHKFTCEFLQKEGIGDAAAVLSFCEQNGGYCDCEVLFNVADRFDF